MKNTLIFLFLFGAINFTSCNQESSDKKYQHRLDSIRQSDSIAKTIEEQRLIDSVASVSNEQKIIQDSIMKLVGE